jgi:PST family polysaccharide transporter
VVWKAVHLTAVKGIFLVRTLVLARLLAPDDFGLLAVATVAIGFLMRITEVGMTPALVQKSDLEEGHYHSAWTVNLIRALCVSVGLLVAAPWIADVFAEPRAAAIIRLLALRPLIDACASIKMARLARDMDYRRLAFAGMPGAVVDTVVAVVLATMIGVWGLVAGALAGATASALASYVAAPYVPRLSLSARAIQPLLRYGRWVFLTALVSVSATSLAQLAISRQLGTVELGLYVLATRLAFLPGEVASQVVGQVAFPLYARIQREPLRVAKAFRSILVGMTTFLLPTYVLLIVLAPWLVTDVLGARWHGAEPIIQLLACVGIVSLWGDACFPLFQGLGQPRWNFWIEALQSCLMIALVWELTARFGVVGAALGWMVAVASSQVVSLVLARRLAPRVVGGLFRPVGLVLAATLAGAATVPVSSRLLAGPVGLAVAAAVAVTVVATAIWMGDRRFKLGVQADLADAFPQLWHRFRLPSVAR